jgi:hypothetical protein
MLPVALKLSRPVWIGRDVGLHDGAAAGRVAGRGMRVGIGAVALRLGGGGSGQHQSRSDQYLLHS